MRLTAGILLGLAGLAALGLWAAGGFEALGWWALRQQQAAQAMLAARIQALRAGDPAAFWSLVGLCAGYGFLHALGPGHGKALIAGAAVGTRATARRMALIAVAGSLAQATVAIAIVYGALALFAATARGTVEGTEHWATLLGNLAVALVGAWLLARGLRALRPRGRARRVAGHAHCGCGHAHGPTPEEAARATTLRATLGLVAAMAARPCTGALVVLVLAWRFGLPGAGIAAVVAMGLGTAAFTGLVALAAVSGRDAAFLAAGEGGRARLLGPGLQIAAGTLILGIGGTLALAALRA